MPQGKVIAVQPLWIGGSTLQSATTLSATSSYTSGGMGGGEEEGNIVYIGVFKDKNKFYKAQKVKDVVWYEDESGNLSVGDIVDFKLNPGRTKNIGGAKDVKKLKGKVIHLPGGVLSKVALLASLLLLVAVMNDTRR